MLTRACSAILLLSGVVHSAVIRGTVTEKMTGYSLSHAVITLQPLPSEGSKPVQTRTNERGNFVFDKLPAGAYLIRSSRRGFMAVEFGQRRWNSAGIPVVVSGEEVRNLQMPMSRYSAITGVVRDSNEVGIPDQQVAAYTTTQPPRLVAHAKSDDRGNYRITGLEPGTYLVRTTGDPDDDVAYIPTFSRQTLRIYEARTATVYPDEDAGDGDVRPIPGQLYEISGAVSVPPNYTVTITLASEMGRTVLQGPAFRFPALPPGQYEMYAEAREVPPGKGVMGGYSEFTLNRNMPRFSIPMVEVRESSVIIDGLGPAIPVDGFIRRKDFAGTGTPLPLTLQSVNRLQLFPGRWELITSPPPGFYVAGLTPSRSGNGPTDGWNEITVNYGLFLSVKMAANPGAIHGVIRNSGNLMALTPVFLERWNSVTRQRLGELRSTRSDMRGNYRFDSLPPGEYRIFSTLEYLAPEPNAFDAALAASVRIDNASDSTMDLELFGQP
jgi:hypothetical protein